MAETLENISEEMTEEKINITETAAKAAEEFRIIIESQKNDSDNPTENVARVKQWLELEAGKSGESLSPVVEALRGGHLLFNDQKEFDIYGEINNVADLLGQFANNPHDFRMKNPSLADHLLTFLEALSGKKEEAEEKEE